MRYGRFDKSTVRFIEKYLSAKPKCLYYFAETLRKYPPVTFLIRKPIKNYTFEGTKITLRKGQDVIIPNYAIQHDSNIYPDPEVFDPERFSAENVKQRNPMYYLPFGDGPRNCIGNLKNLWKNFYVTTISQCLRNLFLFIFNILHALMHTYTQTGHITYLTGEISKCVIVFLGARFAINQTKIGLIKVLMNYKIDVCEMTQIPLIRAPWTNFMFQITHGIYVKLTKLV